MSFEPREYLAHMLAELDYLLAKSSACDQTTFLSDDTLKRAFVRSLEVVGEACKQVPPELRARYPHVECAPLPACETA